MKSVPKTLLVTTSNRKQEQQKGKTVSIEFMFVITACFFFKPVQP